MKKQLKKLAVMLYYYWQGVDLAAYSPRELALAGLDAELLLTIFKMSARNLNEVVPSGRQVKTVAVRALAHLRADAHPQAFSSDPEVIRLARRAVVALGRFQVSTTDDWRCAEVVAYHSGVPAKHISHDPEAVRETRRQAIAITWTEYPWSVEWEWRRWIRLQQWLHNSGLKPEDVGVEAAIFYTEYRQAVRVHWAPKLHEVINRGALAASSKGWHQARALESVELLLQLIWHQRVLAWKEAPCSRLELTSLVEALDQYPLEQEKLLRQLRGNSRF